MQPSIWCQQKLEINLTGHPICIVQPRQESEHVNRTISQPLSPPIHSPRAPRSCSRGRGRGSLRTRWRPCTCWGGRRGRRAAPASASTACSKYVRHHKKSVSGTRWGRGCHTGYRETGQTGRNGQCSPFGPFFTCGSRSTSCNFFESSNPEFLWNGHLLTTSFKRPWVPK